MNYLAHILLSGDNPEIQLGNFIGDAIKGTDYQNYPINLSKGILLHRQIDSFTDIHPIVHRSKKRLHSRYGHYAGVLIDIYYDYFLSRNWSLYSDEPLDSFISEFYKNLNRNLHILPDKMRIISPKIIAQNWFKNYQTQEGMVRVLKGMNKRIKHDIPLDLGIYDLNENHDLLEQDFNEFFPLLQDHTKHVLQTLALHNEEN